MAKSGLSASYSKWDNFDDDEALDREAVATRFDTGEGELSPIDQQFIDASHRAHRLPQNDQEIWQIVVRRLRVWSASSEGAASGEDAVPCRPHCVFVNSLYPSGQVLHRELCVPPERPPSPEEILRITLKAMVNPADARAQQRRPGRIVFVNVAFANALVKSYAAIGIECTQLSESDGVQEHVAEFSSFLVRKDIASRGVASERPGLLATAGVTPELCGALFRECAAFGRAAPWRRLAERQAIKLTFEQPVTVHGATAPAGSVWASVLGKGGDGAGLGLALFFHGFDLERRVLPPGERLARLELAQPACSHTGVTEAELGKRLKRTKPRMYDERTGLEIMYADADAQRSHWKSVKPHARKLEPADADGDLGSKDSRRRYVSPPPPASGSGSPFWARVECSVLLEDPTCVPFDDHDALEEHGWQVAEVAIGGEGEGGGEAAAARPRPRPRYPLPLTYARGEASRPSGEQIVWMARALAGVCALLRDQPQLMQLSSETLQLLNTKPEAKPATLTLDHSGVSEEALARNATVLTHDEWQRAVSMAGGAGAAKAAAAAAAEATDANTTGADADAGADAEGASEGASEAQPQQQAGAQQSQDGGCAVM